MATKTSGERLRDLRLSFGPSATHDLIAELAGVHRVAISKAERDDTDWQSAAMVRGIGRAYGMSVEQFDEFRRGALSFDRARELAKPVVEEAIRRARVRKKYDAIAREAYDRLVATGQVVSDAVLPIARDVLMKRGPMPIAWLAERMIEWGRMVNHVVEHSDEPGPDEKSTEVRVKASRVRSGRGT